MDHKGPLWRGSRNSGKNRGLEKDLASISCVRPGKLLKPSKPQSLYLQKEDDIAHSTDWVGKKPSPVPRL